MKKRVIEVAMKVLIGQSSTQEKGASQFGCAPFSLSLVRSSPFARCLADSNRRRRFCRPLTKPLIQGTVCKCGCKGNAFIWNDQIFPLLFITNLIFQRTTVASVASAAWIVALAYELSDTPEGINDSCRDADADDNGLDHSFDNFRSISLLMA